MFEVIGRYEGEHPTLEKLSGSLLEGEMQAINFIEKKHDDN